MVAALKEEAVRRGDKEGGIELACCAWESGMVRWNEGKHPGTAPQAAGGGLGHQLSQNQSPNM